MNIRRGFFRLWVLFSICWMVAIAIGYYPSIANPYFGERSYYFPQSVSQAQAQAEVDSRSAQVNDAWDNFRITTPEGFRYNMHGDGELDASNRLTAALESAPYAEKPFFVVNWDDQRALDEARNRGITNALEIDGMPEVTLYAKKTLTRGELERQIDEVFRLTSKVKDVVTRQRRWVDVKEAFGFALAPPIFLLIAGAAIGWVFAGFRNKPTA